jgi:hypothetical protein
MSDRKLNADEATLTSRFPALEFWVDYENDLVERRELVRVTMRYRYRGLDAPRAEQVYDVRYRPPWGIIEDVIQRLKASGH